MRVEQTNIKTTRGARSITLEIKRAIEAGRYLDGEQLPSERELSETYSSSRSTIRKALENLEDAGLVSRKVGSGTFVTFAGDDGTDISQVIEKISPVQLIDARIGFERQMTRLAVVHASAADLERMDQVLQKLETTEDDNQAFTQLDSDFHLLLAQASGNPLISALYQQINEVRTHPQWEIAREVVLSPEKIGTYNIFHRRILEALKRRDVNAAIEALNGHMDLARSDLLGTG